MPLRNYSLTHSLSHATITAATSEQRPAWVACSMYLLTLSIPEYEDIMSQMRDTLPLSPIHLIKRVDSKFPLTSDILVDITKHAVIDSYRSCLVTAISFASTQHISLHLGSSCCGNLQPEHKCNNHDKLQ